MSNDWGHAFGQDASRKVKASGGNDDSLPSASGAKDFTRLFDRTAGSSDRGDARSEKNARLLSDEASDLLRTKAAEARQRVAEGLGRSATRASAAAQRLGKQGTHQASVWLARLRHEHIGSACKIICCAVIAMAAAAAAGIVWHPHRTLPLPLPLPVAKVSAPSMNPGAFSKTLSTRAAALSPVKQTPLSKPPISIENAGVLPAAVRPIEGRLVPQKRVDRPPQATRSPRLVAKSRKGAVEKANPRWAEKANADMDAWFLAHRHRDDH